MEKYVSNASWKSQAEIALGVTLGKWQTLDGGDFAQSYAAVVTSISDSLSVALTPGSRLFIKTHGNPPPEHFTTEALGLQWLSETDAVKLPLVLGVSDKIPFLAIEWIEESRQRFGTDENERAFGHQLANMHNSDCTCFGREDRRTTGSQGLPNEPLPEWSEFYATQRLLPLAELAAKRHALDTQIISDIELLAAKLDEFVPADLKPSRLHGDLWAGNRLVDNKAQSWLIDPASHGGHREFDLAMMRLFGGFGQACFDGYQELAVLEQGWQERVSLHQLAPLIVHAIKFGSSYVQPTRDALRRYV